VVDRNKQEDEEKDDKEERNHGRIKRSDKAKRAWVAFGGERYECLGNACAAAAVAAEDEDEEDKDCPAETAGRTERSRKSE
jgi:hypothetical protein